MPPRGAGIWFMGFIASTINSVSPILTLLPTSMNGLPPGSGAAYAVPTIGEITTPGCFEGSIGLTAASVPGCGATSTRTAVEGGAAKVAARATRTRLPSCSISISVRPVSSSSLVSSWINSRSTMLVFGDFPIACPSGADHCVNVRHHFRRSTFLLGAEQAGETGDCQCIAVDAEAGDHCL